MKYFFTITLLLGATISYAQQTITSVNSGSASNPFNWDCTCIPQFDDEIIINHAITLDTDWIINNGGAIIVNANGSLTEDADDRSILVDSGNSTFTNNGITTLTNLAFLNNSSGTNTNDLIVNNGLYIDTLSVFNNEGAINETDSTFSMGTFSNTGTFLTGDFWNGGTFTNTGYVLKDSLLNTGSMTSTSGYLQAYDFATSESFNLSGNSFMIVDNNFYNSGSVNVASGRDIRITNDFYSGDSTFSTANIVNNGLIEIGNDFLNGDTLQGDGIFCIGGTSSNVGRIIGNLDICSNTTSDIFNFNTGTIDPTVTNCISNCTVDVAEDIAYLEANIYPVPFSDILNIDAKNKNINSIEIYNSKGQVVWQNKSNTLNKIDLSQLDQGVYFLYLVAGEELSIHKIMK
jgi:hypothetical protein